jgi:hypothetical protein
MEKSDFTVARMGVGRLTEKFNVSITLNEMVVSAWRLMFAGWGRNRVYAASYVMLVHISNDFSGIAVFNNNRKT